MARGNGQIRLWCARCCVSKVRSPEVGRDCPSCGHLMRRRGRSEAQRDNLKRYGAERFHEAAHRACRRVRWYRRLTAREVAL